MESAEIQDETDKLIDIVQDRSLLLYLTTEMSVGFKMSSSNDKINQHLLWVGWRKKTLLGSCC